MGEARQASRRWATLGVTLAEPAHPSATIFHGARPRRLKEATLPPLCEMASSVLTATEEASSASSLLRCARLPCRCLLSRPPALEALPRAKFLKTLTFPLPHSNPASTPKTALRFTIIPHFTFDHCVILG